MKLGNTTTTGSPQNGFWPNPREEGFFHKTPNMADVHHRSKLFTDRAQIQGHRIYSQEGNCFLFSKSYVPTANRYEKLIYVNDDNEYVSTDSNTNINIDINDFITHDMNNNLDFDLNKINFDTKINNYVVQDEDFDIVYDAYDEGYDFDDDVRKSKNSINKLDFQKFMYEKK